MSCPVLVVSTAASALPYGRWRATHGPVAAWGGDAYAPSPPPLFRLSLVVHEGQLQLQPSIEEIDAQVLDTFYGMVRWH
jgi:hypothetical protein